MKQFYGISPKSWGIGFNRFSLLKKRIGRKGLPQFAFA
ncbi:hypothetical protein SAMN06295967_106215, partial [Belliella buryatensis]